MTVMSCPCNDLPFEFMLSMPARKLAGKPPEMMDFFQCAGCGLMRLGEEFCVPEDDYVDDTYNASMEVVRGDKWHERQSIYGKAMADNLKLPDGASVADVGAGFGFVLDALKPRPMLGIEINDTSRAAIHAKGIPVVPTIAEAATLPDEGDVPVLFDHVISVLTLEHVPDPWAMVEGMKQLMYTDSQLHVVVPALDVERAWLDARYRRVWFCAQHRWYFTPDALGKMLEVVGFKVERWDGWTRSDGWRYTYMKAVPACLN